jgi:hypothetical protein
VILIVYTSNDLEDTRRNVAYGKRKPLFRDSGGGLELTNGEIDRFCLRNVLSISPMLRNASRNLGFAATLDAWAGDETLSEEELDRVARDLIEAIDRLARERGAEFFLVLSPSRTTFTSPSSAHAWFEKLCESGRYACLDLTRTLAPLVQKDGRRKYYVDEAHYTETGTEIVAEAIYDFMSAKRRDGPRTEVGS